MKRIALAALLFAAFLTSNYSRADDVAQLRDDIEALKADIAKIKAAMDTATEPQKPATPTACDQATGACGPQAAAAVGVRYSYSAGAFGFAGGRERLFSLRCGPIRRRLGLCP